MADPEEGQKMEAVKRAYAEIILNTTTESAARVLASERRVAAMGGALAAAKEEAVAALLRLKSIMDSKVKELESQSFKHVREIHELELQLEEAQTTIGSLHLELKKANTELEHMKKFTTCSSTEEKISIQPVPVVPSCCKSCSAEARLNLASWPESVSVSESCLCWKHRSTEGSCFFVGNLKDKTYLENMVEKPSKPDFASYIVSKKHDRNGYTQRVRALEHKRFATVVPLGQSKDGDVVMENCLSACTNLVTKKSHAVGFATNDAREVKCSAVSKKAEGRRTKFSKKDQSAAYVDQAPAPSREHGSKRTPAELTEKLNPETNENYFDGCDLLIRALELDLAGQHEFTLESEVKETTRVQNLHKGMRKGRKRKSFSASVLGTSTERSVVDGFDMKLAMGTSCGVNGCPDEFVSDGVPLTTTENQCQSDTTDDALLSNAHSAGNVGNGGMHYKLDGGNIECNVDSNSLASHLEQQTGPLCRSNSGELTSIPEVNCKHSNAASAEPSEVSVQPERSRSIKYTFNRRKRKCKPSENKKCSASPDVSIADSRVDEQDADPADKTRNMPSESPQSNRIVVQVAHQLASLSEKIW